MREIQHGGFLDGPAWVCREVAAAQFPGAGHRLRIVIERMDARSETARSQAEQTTAAADIEKAFVMQVGDCQHAAQRFFGFGHAAVVQDGEETLPILTEGEALAGGYLLLGGHAHQDSL